MNNELEQRVNTLEQCLREIQERNNRVTLEKSWETSTTRKVAIIVVTYIAASVVMALIGVTDYYISAVIPTMGFFLSTLSLSSVKAIWMRRSNPKKSR
jgi:hypothetical protein